MLKQFDNGNALLDFIDCDAPAVPDHDRATLLTWAMVVIRKDERFLLHHNYNRMQWECAGGGWEIGETIEQCAIREALEETSQQISDLQCHGVFKLYIHNHDSSHYGALYSATLNELQPFVVNNESDRITLWHPDDPLDDHLSDLSLWMIQYVQRTLSD